MTYQNAIDTKRRKITKTKMEYISGKLSKEEYKLKVKSLKAKIRQLKDEHDLQYLGC